MSKTVHSSLLPCQRQCTKLYFHVKDSALNFTSMSKTVHYSQRINDTMPDCSTITSIIPCMSNNSALFVKHQWHYTRLYFTCQRQCSVCLIQWDYARWFTFTLHVKDSALFTKCQWDDARLYFKLHVKDNTLFAKCQYNFALHEKGSALFAKRQWDYTRMYSTLHIKDSTLLNISDMMPNCNFTLYEKDNALFTKCQWDYTIMYFTLHVKDITLLNISEWDDAKLHLDVARERQCSVR